MRKGGRRHRRRDWTRTRRRCCGTWLRCAAAGAASAGNSSSRCCRTRSAAPPPKLTRRRRASTAVAAAVAVGAAARMGAKRRSAASRSCGRVVRRWRGTGDPSPTGRRALPQSARCSAGSTTCTRPTSPHPSPSSTLCAPTRRGRSLMASRSTAAPASAASRRPCCCRASRQSTSSSRSPPSPSRRLPRCRRAACDARAQSGCRSGSRRPATRTPWCGRSGCCSTSRTTISSTSCGARRAACRRGAQSSSRSRSPRRGGDGTPTRRTRPSLAPTRTFAASLSARDSRSPGAQLSRACRGGCTLSKCTLWRRLLRRPGGRRGHDWIFSF
mmetsp:Transcript_49289/g.154815  ORF Transcript_49289/g.154815 Transcript_49289/m.154815 type:complete len:328 (-) Transcript_49289:25-1008(-)